MSKVNPNSTPIDDDVNNAVEQYDFSKGVRGKHYRAYRQGHFVKIERSDGSVSIEHFSSTGEKLSDTDKTNGGDRSHHPSAYNE